MQRSKEWQTGLCEISSTCWCALFFPCCVFAQNVKLMQRNGMNDIPVVDECGCSKLDKPMCAGVLYALGLCGGILAGNTTSIQFTNYANLLGCFSVYIHSRVRGIIRTHNNIGPGCCGEGCTDFCCALWCFSCAMAQEEREMLIMMNPQQVNSIFGGVRMDPPSAPPYAAVHEK